MLHDDTPAPWTAVLCGLGAWLPPRVVTNDDLAARLETSDTWIRARTGIRQRRVVDPGMSTSTLAERAASRALVASGLDTVDALVLATTTPDRPCPATAPHVAARLGLPYVPAFDINSVCSGFVYALAVGTSMVRSGLLQTVLVVGADAYSTIVDPDDRTTVSVFGDGGGAAVLRRGQVDEPGALEHFDLGTDGSSTDMIMVPGGGSFSRALGGTEDPADRWFRMDGKAVFRGAVTRMAQSSRRVLEKVGWAPETLDRVVGHQANARILTALGEELELPPERVACTLAGTGNTAAASIPLALTSETAAGGLQAGHRVLLTAFGGGLSWGSTALVWPELAVVDPESAEPDASAETAAEAAAGAA
jgi:3-oxoacyl-[acyl-carrier-protein] synthase-3